MASFLSLLLFLSIFTTANSQFPPPKGILIDCGATLPSLLNGQQWVPDTGFITAGVSKTLIIPDLLQDDPSYPTLLTVRSFPLGDGSPKKFCYVVKVYRTGNYLIRTTYFYGGVNGSNLPPVFDQIVDGTIWAVVNTTDDYVRGRASYYEGVFHAKGNTMSLCVARNSYTDSDPFISSLEFILLDPSVYNSTDFDNYGLSLVSRSSFGYNGPMIRFPDDRFNRYWEPFGISNTSLRTTSKVSIPGFWNLPPLKVFESALTTEQEKPTKLDVLWPPFPLTNSNYYIALYFAEDRDLSLASPRVFNITINGVEYYRNLTVTTDGVVVFASRWPLSGLTNITLTPAAGSEIGPLINAGEIFNVLPLGERTLTRDVIAIEDVRDSLQNYPPDWSGDPCLPRIYAWTGVTCSVGPRVRVVSLNLTSLGLTGTISPSIANMTALTDILLGFNDLSGSIPNLSSLKLLQKLHMEDNQLGGVIPPSLGAIGSLKELFLQNNNLTGPVPNNLAGKSGLNFKISPGNPLLLSSPPSPT